MSAVAVAWQSIWWISVDLTNPKLSCQHVIFFNLSLLRSNTSHIFLPAITVPHFSQNLIYVPFPMVPVFRHFSIVKPLRFLILLLSIKPSFRVEGKFLTEMRYSVWVTLMHLFCQQNFTSVFSVESIYLFCVGLIQCFTHAIARWTVMWFVINWDQIQEMGLCWTIEK